MPLSFARTAELWLADVARTRRPATHQNYAQSVGLLLRHNSELHERPLTRADLLEFRNARATERSALSANRDLKALRACLRWAWLNDLDHPDVKLGRLLLPAPPAREQALTRAEVERVLAAAAFDPPVLVVLRICSATGFRLGEALALTWADVDLERGTLSVTPKGGWEAKTAAAYRTIAAPELVAWLAEYRKTLRYRGPADLVCQRDTARGIGWRDTSSRLHVRMRRIYERAGVTGKKPTHGLRHTIGHDLVQSGAPIHVAQKFLGHASAVVTLGIYARARAEGVEQAGLELERWRKQRS